MVFEFVINLHGVLTTKFKLGVKTATTACDYKWSISTYQWLLILAHRAMQLLLSFCCKGFFAGSYKKAKI
jgi:hypothetical protein